MSTKTLNEDFFLDNNKKEHIELKNIIKTQGMFYKKERFAVLTSTRLLIFENQTHFVQKRSPRVKFIYFNLYFIILLSEKFCFS